MGQGRDWRHKVVVFESEDREGRGGEKENRKYIWYIMKSVACVTPNSWCNRTELERDASTGKRLEENARFQPLWPLSIPHDVKITNSTPLSHKNNNVVQGTTAEWESAI